MVDSTRRRFLLGLAAGALLPGRGLAEGPGVAPVIRRDIPSSGESLPVLGLGMGYAFEHIAPGEARRQVPELLGLLAEQRNALVDTSAMHGAAESRLSRYAGRRELANRLFLATKVWARGKGEGILQLQQSEQRLGRPIDLIQVHNLVDWKTQLKTLRRWKEQGRVRYIGVTHHHRAAFDALAGVLAREPLDFVQLNYSLAETEAERRLLPLAAERGVAVIVNRPMAGGYLARLARRREPPPWAGDFAVDNWPAFFLKYVISHPAVTCVTPEVTRPRRMASLLTAATGRLPNGAERARMAALIGDWMR